MVKANPFSRWASVRIKEIGERVLLSLFILGLFREWLSPIMKLLGPEGERSLDLFYMMSILLLAAGCLRLPVFLSILLPPLLCTGSMVYLYGSGKGLGWLESFAAILVHDVSGVAGTGRLNAISPEVRMFVLLLGWALLVVSVQLLALSRQSIMLFFSATLIYLLSLELGLGLPVYMGLVRAVLIGLLLQALLHTLRIQEDRKYEEIELILPAKIPGVQDNGNPEAVLVAESFQKLPAAFVNADKDKFQPNTGMNLFTGSSSVTGFATVVTFVLGCIFGLAMLVQALPIQPAKTLSLQQAMANLEAWTHSTSSRSDRVIYNLSGYGSDDGELGGYLTLRNEELFTAVSPQPTYFRGESKSEYTGRGWTQRETQLQRISSGGFVPVARSGLNSSGKEIVQTIMFKEPQNGTVPLAGGGIPVRVNELPDGRQEPPLHKLEVYPASDLVQYNDPAQTLSGYSITVRDQQVPVNVLRASPENDLASISAEYIKLPDSLPKDVGELGSKLVRGTKNRYEAVKSVEGYLKRKYKYSLKTGAPPPGRDFVADFLFNQQKGYCDHFSTAMAILLRTQGIPTRWVKGYASGQQVASEPNRYIVSYADAHSWVEVYFPGSGWVPFDPTPGFDTPDALTASSAMKGVKAEDGLLGSLRGIFMSGLSSLGMVATISVNWLHTHLAGVSAICLGILFILAARLYWPFISVRVGSLMLSTWRRRCFPRREDLLWTSKQTWRCLYAKYGCKPREMTAREYIQLLSGLNHDERSQLNQFIDMWELLCYGGMELDRTATRSFLRQCRQVSAVRFKSRPDLP